LIADGTCSIFVLMVAVLPPLLSDARPAFAETAGLGDRFHYWRGASGRKYLFTLVPRAALADFRSVAVIVADRASGGRLSARFGFPIGENGPPAWHAPTVPEGCLVLVHFLAGTDAACRAVIADLSSVPLRAAA
jgi:hypothetical protein